MRKKYKHEIIYEKIKNKIDSKVYKANDLIPKEVDLMKIYDVSRDTIRKALLNLQKEGYIRKVKGYGTYVNDVKTIYAFSNMLSFTEIIKNQSGDPNSIVISSKLVNIPSKIKNFFSNLDNKIYKIVRIRRNQETKLCYEITYISPDLCYGIDKLINPNASLFELYEDHYDIKIGNGSYKLEAINSNREISNILDIKHNSPILYMEAFIYTNKNEPLYFVEAHYIGSRYEFDINLRR